MDGEGYLWEVYNYDIYLKVEHKLQSIAQIAQNCTNYKDWSQITEMQRLSRALKGRYPYFCFTGNASYADFHYCFVLCEVEVHLPIFHPWSIQCLICFVEYPRHPSLIVGQPNKVYDEDAIKERQIFNGSFNLRSVFGKLDNKAKCYLKIPPRNSD